MKIERFTIAHISDIHRSNDNPISNIALLDSLIRDMDAYTAEGVSKPDLLIVSGDLIQGSDDVAVIQQQYAEALSFLNDFVGKVFDGDKSKIILVPGNHDISWSESRNSMIKIEETEVINHDGALKQKILKQAMETHSNVKWSWPDRSFYRITDQDMYDKRLLYFSHFYREFYEGQREYSLNPDEQFDEFDFPELGVLVIGFNSCFHNDHLNRAGSINPTCIAKAGLSLRGSSKRDRLIIAVWHHNTKGAPYDQDYMDDLFIKNLISNHVKVGFHGHQHRNEILREVNNIIDGEMMLILSAGSLCASYSEIPTGYDQQYNLVELSRLNGDEVQLKSYSRVKTPESSFDNPIWGKGMFNSNTEFITKFDHSIPSLIPNIGKAEKLLGGKDYQGAKQILKQHDLSDPIVRILLLECYTQLESYSEIIDDFSDPQTNAECIALMNANLENFNKGKAMRVLDIEMIVSSSDASVSYLRDQLRGMLK
jgi:predicted phosphodiesterase